MKKVWILFLVVFLTLPVYAYTLKGGVTYTVESARKEAFADVKYSISSRIIKNNKFDPNYEENKKLIKQGIVETNDRYIAYFAKGGYEIVYKNNLFIEYYYDQNGILEHLAKRESLNFPLKKQKYNLDGKLIRIVLAVSENNSYIFFPNGQLESHWLNNKEYDLNGNVINQSF